MLKLQKYKSSTCQAPRDQVVAHHQLSSTSQQQRLNMQDQNLRGSSPPNQNVSQLSGEIPIQASVAPIKLSEKLPSPNLEQVPNVSIDVQKDPSPNNKHVASKIASGFAPLSVSASKKYEVVGSTQNPVGQWSPENQKVKCQYTREFLIQLCNKPLSMKRPDSLPNVEIVFDHTPHRILSFLTRENVDFTPGYLQNSKKRKVKYEICDRPQVQKKVLDQGSPEHQEVKRQYNREFLIQLSKNPLSMKRPDSLPNVEIVLDHTAHRIIPLNEKTRATLDFTPGYLQNSNKHKGNSLQGQSSYMITPIERKSIPLEISCVVPGEYVHFDAHLVRVELRQLFISKVPDEEMFDWIEKHIGCKTNTKTFIRTLTTALIESLLEKECYDSYETVEHFTRKLKRKAKLMLKYIKYEQDLEVACISALQTVCAQYEHPPGLLRKAYRALCDTEVLIDDSFFEWEKSEDSEDQPGKDVCLPCVKFFLNWLRNIGL